MKILDTINNNNNKNYLVFDLTQSNAVRYYWMHIAAQLSAEYGIFVQAQWLTKNGIINHIWFQVGDHRFESVKNLRKALENKSLL